MLAEDAPTEEVLVDVVDRVATVTLNRPDRLNALTATMGVAASAVCWRSALATA